MLIIVRKLVLRGAKIFTPDDKNEASSFSGACRDGGKGKFIFGNNFILYRWQKV